MRTKTWVCQKPEWSTCGPKHILSGNVHLPDWEVHADHCVNGFVYIREPSSYYFDFFYLLHCKCGTNSSKICQKLIRNGGKLAERQNKQEIICLYELSLVSSLKFDER